MTTESSAITRCDGCGKEAEPRRVQVDGSRWVRITACARRPMLYIGERSLIGKEFCSDACLVVFCAGLGRSAP